MDLDRRNFLKYAGIAGIAGGLTLANARNALASTVLTNDYVQADAINAPTGRSATLVVAASNSSASAKSQADYVCEGAADQVEINAAFNALTSGRNYYEKVLCLPGEYSTNGSIYVPDFTTFEMQGSVTLANGSDAHVIRNSDRHNGNSNIHLIGGQYYGNGANQETAVDCVLLQNVDTVRLDNVFASSPKSHVFHFNTATNLFAKGCIGEYSGDDNFAIGPSCSRVSIVNCIGRYGTASYAPASSGFEIDDGSNRISLNGCLSYENAGAGIDIHSHLDTDGPTDITISGCVSESNSVSGINISGKAGAPSQPKRIDVSGNIFNNNSIGVNIYQEVTHVNITGNTISNSTEKDGISLGALLESILINGNTIIGNAECGIDDHPTLKNSTISNNIISNNGQNGIQLESTNTLVNGNRITYNTLNGIDCRGTLDKIACNTIAYNTQHGIALAAASNCQIEYNTIVDNDYLDTNTYSGIYGGTTPTNNSIVGNKVYISTAGKYQAYGIRLNNGTNNIIADNICIQAGRTENILNAGTGTVLTRNLGYVTENTGTGTITTGSTSVDILHGLAAAPTRVVISPTTAMSGKFAYVSAKAASTFTITIDSAAGADIAFDWQAVV